MDPMSSGAGLEVWGTSRGGSTGVPGGTDGTCPPRRAPLAAPIPRAGPGPSADALHGAHHAPASYRQPSDLPPPDDPDATPPYSDVHRRAGYAAHRTGNIGILDAHGGYTDCQNGYTHGRVDSTGGHGVSLDCRNTYPDGLAGGPNGHAIDPMPNAYDFSGYTSGHSIYTSRQAGPAGDSSARLGNPIDCTAPADGRPARPPAPLDAHAKPSAPSRAFPFSDRSAHLTSGGLPSDVQAASDSSEATRSLSAAKRRPRQAMNRVPSRSGGRDGGPCLPPPVSLPPALAASSSAVLPATSGREQVRSSNAKSPRNAPVTNKSGSPLDALVAAVDAVDEDGSSVAGAARSVPSCDEGTLKPSPRRRVRSGR